MTKWWSRVAGGAVVLVASMSVLIGGCESSEDDEGDELDCGAACDLVEYNECTCHPDDPCAWARDGYCDVYTCASVTDEYFDDSADCGAGEACGGDCGLGYLTACTCGADDPCGWAGDDYCDTPSCEQVAAGPVFDDSVDCGGPSGLCDGQCTALQYTACTCAVDDPCGWVGDGTCDRSGCGSVTEAAFDDSADCSGSTGELTFGVTAVRDDLDNNDLVIAADGFAQLGYDQVVRDLNVTTQSLSGYLGQELTTLYHTGHGFEQGIATSDGELLIDQIDLGVENAVIATCLALVGRWDECFGSRTQTVLGYHKVSFDFVDDDVVEQFVNALSSGSSYAEAWYLANSNIYDVSDRWVVYVRDGGSIVEYSARSGASPQAASHAELIQVGRSGRVAVSERLLASTERLTSLSAPAPRVRVGESEPIDGRVAGAFETLRPTRQTGDEAQRVAEAMVSARLGGVPADAVVAPVVEIVARRDGGAPVVVGHLVRWRRQIGSWPVRGNRVTDHIAVLVSAAGAVAWSRFWPEVTVEREDEGADGWDHELLNLGEAVTRAADAVDRSVKGELNLRSARAVLGTLGAGRGVRRLVPAWELESDDGATVVIDALTGRPLL